MNDPTETGDPDWDAPLSFALTPDEIVHTLFGSAENVHTGWESCVDRRFILTEITALSEEGDSYCRFIEQEYVEDAESQINWHDWTVELKLGEVIISAHWRCPDQASPSDWHWCASESENAFASACILIGKRVRRGIVIEESVRSPRTRTVRH